MKGKKVFWPWVVILFIAILYLFGGCGSEPMTKTGDLVLNLSEPNYKMILPGGDIEFDHYIITITHQITLNQMSQEITPPPYEVTFANIPSGAYDILVTGFNALDELLGSGIGVVSVLANDTTSQTVQVEYETGSGNVAIDYTLTPSDLIYSPGIEGELWDQVSWTPVSITQTGPGAWGYDASLPAGFYAHRFELHSYGDTDIHVAGGLEAIFVMTGRTSAGLYAFNEGNITIPTIGSTIIIIWEPVDQPFSVVFTDGISQVDIDSEFTLTASADITVDQWYWAKNGIIIEGENNSSIILSSASEERCDNYSVLAKAGGALSSSQKIVSSVIPPPQIDSFVWTIPNVPTNWPGDSGAVHPIQVEVKDEFGDPIPDDYSVYWRVVSTDQDFREQCEIVNTPTLTSGGYANATFRVKSNLSGEHYGYVEVSSSADFSTILTSSPQIGVGNAF